MAFPGLTLHSAEDAANYTTNSFTTILDRVDNRPKFGQIDAFSLVTAASELSGDGLQSISDLLSGGWAEIGRLVGMDDDTAEFLSRYVENDDGELVENGKMPWRNATTDLSGNPWNEAFIPGGIVDYKGLADGFLSTLIGGYMLKLFGPTVFRSGVSLFGSVQTSLFRNGVKRDLNSIKNMRDLGSQEITNVVNDYSSAVVQTDSVPELLLAISEAFFYDSRSRLSPAMQKMRNRVELPD